MCNKMADKNTCDSIADGAQVVSFAIYASDWRMLIFSTNVCLNYRSYR